MASFCECGADKVICQVCGKDVCSVEEKIKWIENKGNVCETCQGDIWQKQHWTPKPGDSGFDLMC